MTDILESVFLHSVTRAVATTEVDEILPRIRKVILDENGGRQGIDLDILRIQEK